MPRARDEPVLALRPVDHERPHAPCEDAQRDEPEHGADGEERDPAAAPATSFAGDRLGSSPTAADVLEHELLAGRDPRVGAALVEPEGRIRVRHQRRVAEHAERPAVEADDEVEQAARVAPGEEEREAGDEDEETDEAAAPAPRPVLAPPHQPAAATDDHADDEVLRDREQPPLDEHEPPRERAGVLDRKARRVVGDVVECEWRIAVGAERSERVEADPPRPAEHADVEVEDRPWVPAGEEDREERDDAEQDVRRPQEDEDDVVGDREQPLDDPQPAAQLGVEPPFDVHGVRPGGHRLPPR